MKNNFKGIGALILSSLLFVSCNSTTPNQSDSMNNDNLDNNNSTDIVTNTLNNPNLVVRDQMFNDNFITVQSVDLDKPGYLVIYQDFGGTLGEPIGRTNLLDTGIYNNVEIQIDPSKAGKRVHAVIHYDDNNNSLFDFPNADLPAEINDKTVMLEINSENISEEARVFLPNLVVQDQNLINTNNINVNSVYLDKPGYVSITNDINGNTGNIIGYSSYLPAGPHNDVGITIDRSKLTNELHAVLHYEENDNTSLEFPNTDFPATVNQRTIETSFDVQM